MTDSAETMAYNYIRNAIIDRILLPNEQIVEQQVAEQSGISRTPIRSALKRLSYEGMVVLRPHKGAFVVNPSRQEVRDTFECKFLLETEIARLACLTITEEELEELEQNLALAMRLHAEQNYDHFIDLNYDFHMVIGRATHNRFYKKFLHELMTRSNIHLLVYDDFRDVPLEEMESFREYRAILDALRVKDQQAAQEAVLAHLKNTYQTLNLSLPLRSVRLEEP